MGFNKPTSDSSSALAATKAGASGLETNIQPINQPIGKKPKQKSTTATFLGADAEPGPASGNNGGKTLLGVG